MDILEDNYAEWWDELTAAWQGYFDSEHTFATSSGTSDYALPSDFLKIKTVHARRNSGSRWIPCHQYNLEEEGRLSSNYLNAYHEGPGFWYRLTGDNIRLQPDPSGVYTVRLIYVPCAPKLSATSDTIDGKNGWEKLLVLMTVREIRERREESVSDVDRAIARQLERLRAAADDRSGAPEKIQDIDAAMGDW